MWSRDVHLVKTEKEYIPFGSPAYQLGKDETSDLGSLMCQNSSNVCVDDSTSSLGGVCICIRIVDFGDKEADVAGSTPRVKMLTVKEKLKAKHLLEAKEGKVGVSGLVGEVCTPSTTEGFVDVGL